MFARRLLTAAVLLACFVTAVLEFEQLGFSILVGGILFLAAQEWGRLCALYRAASFAYAAAHLAMFSVAVWALFPLSVHNLPEISLFAASLVYWVTLVPYWLWRSGSLPALAAGPATLLPCSLAMVALPRAELLFMLALVWIADTAAYLTGRTLGVHKLAPGISPGKTWEGVLGALAGTLLYAIVCGLTLSWLQAPLREGAWPLYLAGIAALCVLSVLGDLFESLLKRRAQVKDSGTLLPGHGGVLDRIDSVTASLPAAALLLKSLSLG